MKLVFLMFLITSIASPLFSQNNIVCNAGNIDANGEAFFYLSTTAVDFDSTWILKCSLDNFGIHILDTILSSDLIFQGIGIGFGQNDTTTFFGELNNVGSSYNPETGTFGPFVNIGRNFSGHKHHIWSIETFDIHYYNTASGAALNVDIYEAIDNETRVKTADCAVDQYGNVWFITGVDITFNWATESLVCMDTTGTILNTYDFEINSKNAYGMMFLGPDLYIGFGGLNDIYTHQLCKINFAGNNAEIGETFEFKGTTSNYNDLASCNESELTASLEDQSSLPHIYPNPVLNELHLENFPRDTKVEILSLIGEVCYHVNNISQQTTIDMTNFAHGLYVLRIYNEFGELIKTFRVIHS